MTRQRERKKALQDDMTLHKEYEQGNLQLTTAKKIQRLCIRQFMRRHPTLRWHKFVSNQVLGIWLPNLTISNYLLTNIKLSILWPYESKQPSFVWFLWSYYREKKCTTSFEAQFGSEHPPIVRGSEKLGNTSTEIQVNIVTWIGTHTPLSFYIHSRKQLA